MHKDGAALFPFLTLPFKWQPIPSLSQSVKLPTHPSCQKEPALTLQHGADSLLTPRRWQQVPRVSLPQAMSLMDPKQLFMPPHTVAELPSQSTPTYAKFPSAWSLKCPQAKTKRSRLCQLMVEY